MGGKWNLLDDASLRKHSVIGPVLDIFIAVLVIVAAIVVLLVIVTIVSVVVFRFYS